MSDLSATQCGCQTSECGSCNSWIWIIVIYFLLSGNNGCGSGCGGNSLSNLFGENSCCEWILILILFTSCCGQGSFLF